MGERWRVLVVDDDAVDRAAIRRGLARAGVEAAVDEAWGRDDALAAVAATRYDCIFLDYNVPGSQGPELLREIARVDLDAPVVMFTGQGDEQVAVELMKAGAVDYLSKAAATPDRLASSLRYAVALARAKSERRAAREALEANAARARFLAEAVAAISGSLDLTTTLARLADIAVPTLGDYSLVYLVDEGGRLGAVASAHRDPAMRQVVREIERGFEPGTNRQTNRLANVITTGETYKIDRVTPELLDRLAVTPEERAAYAALEPATALFTPLRARRVLGALVVCRQADRPAFSEADVRLTQDLAYRAATAIENARLYEEAERARSRTERLQRVTARLAAVLPREDVARLFVAQVREALNADTAWLALLSPDGAHLCAAADVGFEPDQIRRFACIPVDAPMPPGDIVRDGIGRAFATKAELIERYPALGQPMADMDQEGVALLPLSTGADVFGVMTVGFRERHALSADERALATALAQQCAQALERARLYEAERDARAEAEAARREAEEANRAKSQFLARMSHDLRTPLNAIGGYAQLIEEGIYGATTEGQRESLARIRRAQEHLLTLINDILSFAKLEAGQVHLQLERVGVVEAIEELRPLIEPQIAERGLSLGRPDDGADLTVIADRERLIQILLNLLTNAVKFTPPGGAIAIECASRETTVAIGVTDTGQGIPPHRLEAIFDPFVQAGHGSVERREGVGLGLAISRELARMMGGELTVVSVVGEGSTFTLTLPRGLRDQAGGDPIIGSSMKLASAGE